MRLAWKNLMARKWTTAKVMISLVVMIIIMCVFTAYTIALNEEYTRSIRSYKAGHYIELTSDGIPTEERLSRIASIQGIESVQYFGTANTPVNLNDMTFVFDGIEYECYHLVYDGMESTEGDPNMVRLHRADFSVFPSGERIFNANDINEMDYRWVDKGCMLIGKDSVSAGEIILSKWLLDDLGLGTEVYEQEIDIRFDGKEYNDLKVVGITTKEFHQLTANVRQDMIVSLDSQIARDLQGRTEYYIHANLDAYMQATVIGEELFRLGYRDVRLGSEYGLFIGNTVTIVSNILTGVMVTVGLGILAALTINIIVSMRFMIIKKTNFYGMISAYGLKDKGIFNVLFFEMMYTAFLAVIVAYIVSYGLLYLLDFILTQLVNIGVIFTWANFLITFAVALVFTIGIVLATTIVNYVTFTKRYSAKLLNKGINN